VIDNNPRRRLLPFTLTWSLLYLISIWLTWRRDIPPEIGMYAILCIGIPLTLLVALEWSSKIPDRKTALIVVSASAVWWLVSAMLVRSELSWRVWHTVNSVMLLVGTYTLGNWLAGELEKVGHLIPVCILGTVVDVWSVLQGPSKSVGEQVVEHTQSQVATGAWHPPPFLGFMILSWPQPGEGYMTPLFGFGDLVFIAIFLAASRRFRLSVWKAFFLVLGGLAMSIGLVMTIEQPVPALPFICGLFLIGNWRKLSLSKNEWKLTLTLAGVIVIVGLTNWLKAVILVD